MQISVCNRTDWDMVRKTKNILLSLGGKRTKKKKEKKIDAIFLICAYGTKEERNALKNNSNN